MSAGKVGSAGKVSSAVPVHEAPGGDTRVKAWSFTALLVALYVVNWGDKAVLGLAAQPLADELGLSASQIGLVGSAFFLTFTIGGFFAGLLNKWMTLKWALAVLAIGWSLTMLPIVLAATFSVLLVTRMLLGLLEGPSSALLHTALYSWHPREKRGLPSACLTAAASIAKIVLAPALAVLAAAYGWRSMFVVLAVAGLVWLLAWLPSWKVGPYGDDSSAPATDEGGAHVPWSKVLTAPTFLGGMVAVLGMYALVSVVLTWLPSYFELGLGYSRVQAGIMFGFPSIASIVLMFLLTGVSDRLIARGATSRVLRGVVPSVGLLVCGIAMALLPVIGIPWVAVAVVSVGYAFGSSIFPLFNSGLSEIVPPRQLAGTLGVFLAVMSIGGLLGPYVTGLIVEAAASPAEGYARAFQVFGIVAIIGAVIALLTVNPERDKARLLPMTDSPQGSLA